MYPWIRFGRLAVKQLRMPATERLGTAFALRMRAMPWDCDPQLHINNARYLVLMELGRFQLFAAHGMMQAFFRQRWRAVVAGAHILYRRPIDMFTPFCMESRFCGASSRFLIAEHRLTAAGRTVTLGYFPVAISGPDGLMTPQRVIGALRLTRPPGWSLPAAAVQAVTAGEAMVAAAEGRATPPPATGTPPPDKRETG